MHTTYTLLARNARIHFGYSTRLIIVLLYVYLFIFCPKSSQVEKHCFKTCISFSEKLNAFQPETGNKRAECAFCKISREVAGSRRNNPKKKKIGWAINLGADNSGGVRLDSVIRNYTEILICVQKRRKRSINGYKQIKFWLMGDADY